MQHRQSLLTDFSIVFDRSNVFFSFSLHVMGSNMCLWEVFIPLGNASFYRLNNRRIWYRILRYVLYVNIYVDI